MSSLNSSLPPVLKSTYCVSLEISCVVKAVTALYTARLAVLTSKVKASAVSIATEVSPVPGELNEVILNPILFGSDFPTRLSVSEAVPPLAAALDSANERMVLLVVLSTRSTPILTTVGQSLVNVSVIEPSENDALVKVPNPPPP